MHILLFVPDNHVTRNFVPQLWPFLLRARTPAGHRVTIIDGNAQRLSIAELVQYIKDHDVDLLGMGFMTRMAQRAYDTALAVRAATKVPIVFGGPHVTALPDEPLGRTGLPRTADAVVLGEADESWADVVEDAARGALKDVYGPDRNGLKPGLTEYAAIDWGSVDLGLFDLMRFVPDRVRGWIKSLGIPFEKVYVVPVETGRGCPYGCEFCTVTGFFGRQLRFRSNECVIAELLTLKRRAERERAMVSVFFIDDNFAINRERMKSLLRDMIRLGACLPWVAQISVNLLDDAELVKLIGASGGRFIFMGLESVNTDSLKSAHKSFNKPAEYGRALERLAEQNVYAITSFIVGLEDDRPGTAGLIDAEMAKWPPVLPVFGLLTPFPATPLYKRLAAAGRLLNPTHWLESVAFKATFEFAHFSPASAEAEVRQAWKASYRPAAFARTQRWMVAHGKPFDAQVMFLVARLIFRGIYFQQGTALSWIRVLAANSATIARIVWRRLFRRPAADLPVPSVEPAVGAAVRLEPVAPGSLADGPR
jgi:radical SAM superfamily enzyme YgiQ (UPF0313 family)